MKRFWIISLLIIGIGAIAAWSFKKSTSAPLSSQPVQEKTISNAPGDPQQNATESAGGVTSPSNSTPKSSGETAGVVETRKTAATEKRKYSDDLFEYGKSPEVAANLNAQTKSVAEALRQKSHPERLSALSAPKPFDPETYRLNPKAYLETPEPARANFPAQPTKDVQRILAISSTRVRVKQGESAVLRVRAAPNFPVTFTSQDLGKFSNELTTISVEASSEGVAETRFFGTPGTVDNVRILCASPVCSGQVLFSVFVEKE